MAGLSVEKLSLGREKVHIETVTAWRCCPTDGRF